MAVPRSHPHQSAGRSAGPLPHRPECHATRASSRWSTRWSLSAPSSAARRLRLPLNTPRKLLLMPSRAIGLQQGSSRGGQAQWPGQEPHCSLRQLVASCSRLNAASQPQPWAEEGSARGDSCRAAARSPGHEQELSSGSPKGMALSPSSGLRSFQRTSDEALQPSCPRQAGASSLHPMSTPVSDGMLRAPTTPADGRLMAASRATLLL